MGQRVPGAVIQTVNYAEMLSRLAERGQPPEAAEEQREQVGLLQIIHIDPGLPEDALAVARLRPLTWTVWLGGGDQGAATGAGSGELTGCAVKKLLLSINQY
ncbi:hypothetical protein [Deinococcus marmoris]|uniref:Uncharacterized protein n=1 Tax=Deinococcus marmoris TaxID=249408 RepID=A0A1U7NS02_9DEIO|nr:hypothetical protein [Deinococcus marmoris]OLV15703.1 hypothetical protein BOO71_0014149 [Deinococcus marmoris]